MWFLFSRNVFPCCSYVFTIAENKGERAVVRMSSFILLEKSELHKDLLQLELTQQNRNNMRLSLKRFSSLYNKQCLNTVENSSFILMHFLRSLSRYSFMCLLFPRICIPPLFLFFLILSFALIFFSFLPMILILPYLYFFVSHFFCLFVCSFLSLSLVHILSLFLLLPCFLFISFSFAVAFLVPFS